MPDKLPEEFAPTGPKLSKFPILPAPPIRPHLFPDEARFVLRLSLLAGGTEFAAWAWLARSDRPGAILALGALRLLRPLWARLGTRLPRPAIALGLLAVAFAGIAANLAPPLAGGGPSAIGIALVGLLALGDLCATCIGDRITVERRPTAFAWLDIGQAIGAVVGVALGPIGANASILVVPILVIALPDLRDQGTPRSSWPMAAYLSVLRTPIAAQLTVLALACGLLFRQLEAPAWVAPVLPLAGMALAARLEARMPNAVWLPRIAVALALLGLAWPPLRLFAMGVMFAAIPAAVVRGAGEMERPIASSLAWSALFTGAAIGAVLRF